MMMTTIGDTSNTNATYGTPAVTKAPPSKLKAATGKANGTPAGATAKNMVGITLFNPAKQLVADNENSERGVLQQKIRDGQPTGELENITANARLGWNIFWTLEGIEVNKPEGIFDKQIELDTIKGILQDTKKFEKFKERLNISSESDETIKKELNLLIEFQSQYGSDSDSKLTIGQFREAYYDKDRSFSREINEAPEAKKVLNNLVNGKW